MSALTAPPTPNVTIDRFDFAHEPEDSCLCLARLQQQRHVACWSMPEPPDLATALWQLSRRGATAAWVARNAGGDIVGDASVSWPDPDEASAVISVWVVPSARHRGIGTALVRTLARYARGVEASRLRAVTLSNIEEGEQFATHLGTRRGMDTCTQQMDVRRLNVDLLDAILQRPLARLELRSFVEPYRDDEAADVAVLKGQVRHTYGREASGDDLTSAVAALRLHERNQAAEGYERWAVCATDATASRVVGYAEAVWTAHDPRLLVHQGTAVAESHRSQGIGLAMQALLLKRALAVRTGVRYVRVTNRAARMIAHNHELGYGVCFRSTRWEIGVTELGARVGLA